MSVTHTCEFTNTHWIVCFQWVRFMVFELCFHQVDLFEMNENVGGSGSMLRDRGRVCAGGGGRKFIHAPCPHWLRAVEAGADPTSVWTFQPPISPWGMNDHISAALGPQKQLSPGLSDSQVYAGWGKGGVCFLSCSAFLSWVLPAHPPGSCHMSPRPHVPKASEDEEGILGQFFQILQ